MRNGVDKVRFRLGIHDPLRVIQAVVAGEHVAHRNGGQVIRHAGKAKELWAYEQLRSIQSSFMILFLRHCTPKRA